MADEWNKAADEEKRVGGDAQSVYSYSKFFSLFSLVNLFLF